LPSDFSNAAPTVKLIPVGPVLYSKTGLNSSKARPALCAISSINGILGLALCLRSLLVAGAIAAGNVMFRKYSTVSPTLTPR